MKKIVAIFGLALILISGTAIPGYALDLDLSDAKIDADGGGLTVEKVEAPFHFIKETSLAPGTTITRSYSIGNSHDYDFDLYLYAENPISTPAALDLVNKIDLVLSLDGVEVYSGVVGGGLDEGGRTMENDIHLGRIERGGSYRLTATFSIPGDSIGNEYQGAKAEVDWVFRAICAPEKNPPDTPPHPRTGDFLYHGILLVAVLALVSLVVSVRRKRSVETR